MEGLEHTRILAVLAYLLLTVSVTSGEILAGRLRPSVGHRLLVLHRCSSVSGLTLALLHGLDPARLGGSTQAALGIAAFLLAAVPAVAWATRRRVGLRWQLIHRAAYAGFATASVHAIFFHQGAMPPFEAALYGASIGTVALLALLRHLGGRRKPVGGSTRPSKAASRANQS